MKSISNSRAKTWHGCKLNYDYTYVDKFVPVNKKPIAVINKGLALHETFEALLKFENYNGETPNKGPLRSVSLDFAKAELEEHVKANNLSEEDRKEFNLELAVKRWLSFKHDYLDKRGNVLYSEKEYNEVLFGETKTITILDLLEDLGNGKFVIYDYKTPQSAVVSRYKEQLILYAYMMAKVKGIIDGNNPDYNKVAECFELYVFFPLLDDLCETYEASLKPVKFTAAEVQAVIEGLKKDVAEIDAFDFTKPAAALTPCKTGITCKWCNFAGSLPQPDLISANGKAFEGCPLTRFAGYKPLNESFKLPDVKDPTESF